MNDMGETWMDCSVYLGSRENDGLRVQHGWIAQNLGKLKKVVVSEGGWGKMQNDHAKYRCNAISRCADCKDLPIDGVKSEDTSEQDTVSKRDKISQCRHSSFAWSRSPLCLARRLRRCATE